MQGDPHIHAAVNCILLAVLGLLLLLGRMALTDARAQNKDKQRR